MTAGRSVFDKKYMKNVDLKIFCNACGSKKNTDFDTCKILRPVI